MRLEILTEEKSMEVFLRGLLPRILPPEFILDQNCFIHSHDGKSHLLKSIPKKMMVYFNLYEEVRVLIIHDQDSNDCVLLKKKLEGLCINGVSHLVRIACRELENWYLGDFNAMELVFPQIRAVKFSAKAKYRIPDRLNGSDELRLLTKHFSKINTAREMCKYISIDGNKSTSFNHFVSGLQKLLSS